MAIQRVLSKLAKTDVLLKHGELRDHIPDTRKLSHQSITDMIHTYGMVYVKPDVGTFGSGVIRVERAPEGFRAQLGTRVYKFGSIDGLYAGLLRIKHRGTYVVQRGIHLLKHKGRRFDIRVMVQMSPRGAWETTGIIGRLAHPKRIVTNYHSGGTPMSFQSLMASHLSADRQQAYMTKLRALGTRTARQLQTRYPGLKELGLDVAVDRDLRPWILEVNTKPDPFLFRKLKDKSVFRKVYRYADAYGRFKKKRRSVRRLTSAKRARRA